MAGKKQSQLKWFKFYPADWQYDLDDQPLEIEGAWIRIVGRLHREKEYGRATKSIGDWCKILKRDEGGTMRILEYLQTANIASIRAGNGCVTVSSRRMIRDEEKRKTSRVTTSRSRGKEVGDNGDTNCDNHCDTQCDRESIRD